MTGRSTAGHTNNIGRAIQWHDNGILTEQEVSMAIGSEMGSMGW